MLENTSANVHFIPNSLIYPSVRIGERLPFLDANFKPFFEECKTGERLPPSLHGRHRVR